MSTLVVRIASPLMSWGDRSRFNTRHTASDPTLSALQGMLAAAAGTPRDDELPAWIADLEPVVRVDQPGRVLRDYHTVNERGNRKQDDWPGYRRLEAKTIKRLSTIRQATGGRYAFDTLVTERYYQNDATYLAFIKDPRGRAAAALAAPVWAPYAGRKSCPLTEPLLLGRHPSDPLQAAAMVPTAVDPAGPLDAIVFSDPDQLPSTVAATRSETRNDRIGPGRTFVAQPRVYIAVEPPHQPDSWFVIAGQLDPPEVPA